jgi:class 3 adenylate cyclase
MARPTDELISFEASAALAAAIPGAVLCTFPPGPHLSFDIGEVFVAELLEFIGESPATGAIERELITVMFTDIVSSTERLSAQGDADWRRQLDMHDSIVDTIVGKHGGVRAKHTGDGVFAVFTGPSMAARCALELVTALGTRGIPIRVGVHIGECERRGDDWSGLAVHVGARIGAMAGPGEVLASRTVRDLSAGSGLDFEGVGVHQLKGLAEEVALYRVRAQAAR